MIITALSNLHAQLAEPSPSETNSAQAGAIEFFMMHPLAGYFGLIFVLSVLTFFVYGWDKRQAKTNVLRIPEKRMHAMAFLGGWPGALLGQSYFRHKTQKLKFKIATWGAATLHLILLGCYLGVPLG